jgi:ADP-ribosylglycohydrolase
MDSIILCILGDIVGFNNGEIKMKQEKFTRKKYGDEFRNKAVNNLYLQHIMFIKNGGVNRNIVGFKYSFNTLMLFATLKGIAEKKEYKANCTKEYIKLYNKYGEKKLSEQYFANNTYLKSLQLLSKGEKIDYNNKHNDSMVLPRILPFGLLFWKEDDRSKLITEIIENISITHKNNTCFLSAITLGLFISFKKNGIKLLRWGHKLVEYLLSKEFDDIIKENKMYNTEFMLDKEDYVSIWNQYLDNSFVDNKFKNDFDMIYPIYRAKYLFYSFNDIDTNEFIYGIESEQSIINAYDSLLYCNEYWENLILYGITGITDNSVMGCLCGILFGIEYGINSSINKYIFKDEPWIKKALILGKNIS